MSTKTVWIVGASSGIGRATAREYASRGYKVILSSRRKKELDELSNELDAESVTVPVDVTDTASHGEIVERTWSRHGPVNILINSAGVSQREKALDTVLEVDKKIMDINYFGTVSITKCVVPKMIANGGGDVAVITSMMGKYSSPYRTGYAASKHALHGFFDGLRAETIGDNIRVTLVCPGFVKTRITYNSLRGNGEPLNKMSNAQANGLEPDYVAGRIADAVKKGKREIYMGGFWERLGLFLKRFFPAVFAWAIVRKNVL